MPHARPKRYDLDLDLRDRARLWTARIGLVPASLSSQETLGGGHQAAVAALRDLSAPPKPPPLTLVSQSTGSLVLGTLSSAVGHQAVG